MSIKVGDIVRVNYNFKKSNEYTNMIGIVNNLIIEKNTALIYLGNKYSEKEISIDRLEVI